MERAWWMRKSRLPLLAAAFVLLVAIAASCGGGGQSGGQAGGGDNNNLVIGYDQEPPSLNPFNQDALATSDMVQGILEKPYEIQPDLSLAPQLADGDPKITSRDPFTVEYKLKQGLTWSDGEPVTSDDAKYTYEQIINPDNQVITRIGFDKLDSFETPDDQTVRMVFKEPYAAWRDMLSGSDAWILPRHVYEGKDFNTALNDKVIGSGPYQLKEYKKGESLTYEPSANYSGPEPAIKNVTVRFIPDTNSLVAALQAGEVQFINPPPDIGLYEKLKAIDGAKATYAAGTEWEQLTFNVKEIPDPKLRQAVAYGINREQILNEILKGQNIKPLQSVLVPDQKAFYTPAWEQYKFDPQKAKGLVKEAVDAGADPTITFSTTSGNTLRETLQQVFQQQMKDIGITVETKNYSPEQFFGEITLKSDFQLGEFAWVQTPEPQITTIYGGNQLPPDGQNYGLYDNKEVTRLLEESDRTIDEGPRADLLKQAQDLMAKDLPVLPLYQRPVTYGFSAKLQGPEVNPTQAGPFWNIGEWSFE